MNQMNETFLMNLLSSISVSGYEEPVQEVVEAEMKNYADEIGLMISNIREDGRLQVIDRGGIVPATYPGRQVRIKTKNGEVYGVVEAYRSLFKDENLGTKQFLIDIGAKDKADALNYVSLGDPIVPDTPIRKLANGKFTARALDDRLGVCIIMEALKRSKELGCKVGIYAASTTGEETTKTGAYWTSARIQPTMAIVVDVTYTSDCSGMDPAEMGTVCLGEGPVLCNSPIVVKALNEKMEECAKKAGISVQREAASRLSYTDGDQIHFSNQGVPMVLVSIPLRYMHMPAEVADEKDVEGCIELIAQFLAGYQG